MPSSAEVGRRRQAAEVGFERQAGHPKQAAAIPPRRRERVMKTRVEVIRVPSLSAIDWLLHGFSTRTGGKSRIYRPSQRAGELNLGFTASDDKAIVAINRERFMAAVVESTPLSMVTLRQIHSSLLRRVTAVDADTETVLSTGC